MAPEQGDGWLARVVRAENMMAEKVDQLEGKQKRAHEHDASISLEITRTDGDGFPGRASVHAWQPLPRTLSRRSTLNHRVRHLSNLFCASSGAFLLQRLYIPPSWCLFGILGSWSTALGRV
jgi:hypothetical protein